MNNQAKGYDKSNTRCYEINKLDPGMWSVHIDDDGLEIVVHLNTGTLKASARGLSTDFASTLKVIWDVTPAAEVELINKLAQIKSECGIPNDRGSFNYSLEQHELLKFNNQQYAG